MFLASAATIGVMVTASHNPVEVLHRAALAI